MLPQPPDIRWVEVRSDAELEQRQVHQPTVDRMQQMALQQLTATVDAQKLQRRQVEISRENTVLIGDYTSVAFSVNDTKWLVQSQGNATLASMLALIKDDILIVDRKYLFFQLGGNQLRTAMKQKIYATLLDMVVLLRDKNPQCGIYFIGVLPRVVDNLEVKPLIMRFNQWLTASVHSVDSIFGKVKFLPVHLQFIDGVNPKVHLFDAQQPLLLNHVGATLFKEVTFQLAEFVKNNT